MEFIISGSATINNSFFKREIESLPYIQKGLMHKYGR
jgi:hypothetical protein